MKELFKRHLTANRWPKTNEFRLLRRERSKLKFQMARNGQGSGGELMKAEDSNFNQPLSLRNLSEISVDFKMIRR